jgi:hypothetical protein
VEEPVLVKQVVDHTAENLVLVMLSGVLKRLHHRYRLCQRHFTSVHFLEVVIRCLLNLLSVCAVR